MKELLTEAGAYAGEIIITAIALLIRSIEKKIVIRRKKREWLRGEIYSKIEDAAGNQAKK
jgi:hypothetical protein